MSDSEETFEWLASVVVCAGELLADVLDETTMHQMIFVLRYRRQSIRVCSVVKRKSALENEMRIERGFQVSEPTQGRK